MTAWRRLAAPFALFSVLLVVALSIRGTGWDGDSLVSIAQFQKLVHPLLFGTPDSGTSPKLLPIAVFGAFHAVTGSYAIHWLTIALTAFAVARLVRLPAERGGGPIWLLLPFLSPLWINTILSADNPALAAGFSILGLASLLEGRPNLAVVHFLLSEFSRPGGYSIIAVLILLTWVPAFAPDVRRPKLSVAVPALVLGLCHSALSYRLSVPAFADFVAQTMFYPGSLDDPLKFKRDPAVVTVFLRHLWHSLPLVLPVWVLAVGAAGWVASAWTKWTWSNAFWGLLVIPLSFLPIAAFMLGPYYAITEYMLFLAPLFLAGVAMLAGRLWPPGSRGASLALCAALALGAAVIDGFNLKGRFEVNPPSSVWWTSDRETKRLIEQARERAGRPLVLLASCDVITLLIDVPGSLSRLAIFSNEGVTRGPYRYLRDCTQLYFRQRADDILLPGEAGGLRSGAPDVIYTTKTGMAWLGSLDLAQFETHELRAGRILLVRAAGR